MSASSLAKPKATSEKDRRRSERKPYVIEAWISSPTATKASERIEATAVNISRHGVAFQTPKMVPTGTFFRMEVGMGVQKLISEIRVISCRKDEAGHYEIGAEFC